MLRYVVTLQCVQRVVADADTHNIHKVPGGKCEMGALRPAHVGVWDDGDA